MKLYYIPVADITLPRMLSFITSKTFRKNINKPLSAKQALRKDMQQIQKDISRLLVLSEKRFENGEVNAQPSNEASVQVIVTIYTLVPVTMVFLNALV